MGMPHQWRPERETLAGEPKNSNHPSFEKAAFLAEPARIEMEVYLKQVTHDPKSAWWPKMMQKAHGEPNANS